MENIPCPKFSEMRRGGLWEMSLKDANDVLQSRRSPGADVKAIRHRLLTQRSLSVILCDIFPLASHRQS